jgi:hypothetical protein
MNKQQLAIIAMVLMVENKYFSNFDRFCLKSNALFGSSDYDYTFWFDYFHVMKPLPFIYCVLGYSTINIANVVTIKTLITNT